MFFQVTVLTSHLTQVFLKSICVTIPIAIIRGIDGIDSGGWGGTFSFLLLDAIVVVFLLFFFNLLNDLFNMLGGCWPSYLSLKLKFLSSKIFHGGSLIASFITFYRSFTMSNALIYFPKHKGV